MNQMQVKDPELNGQAALIKQAGEYCRIQMASGSDLSAPTRTLRVVNALDDRGADLQHTLMNQMYVKIHPEIHERGHLRGWISSRTFNSLNPIKLSAFFL